MYSMPYMCTECAYVMTVNSVNLKYMVSLAGGATPCMERKG